MLREIGLREAILHSNKPDGPPETNSANGNRVPIDGIFTTANIKPSQAGYTGYNVIMQSDHRGLWMDIPFASALGFNPPNLHKRAIKQVRAHDPTSVATFNKLVKEEFKKGKDAVPKNLALLKQLQIEKAPLEEIIAMHSLVLRESELARHNARRRTRKAFMGKYAWSPEWRSYKMPVLLWTKVVKNFTGKVNNR